MIYIYKKNKNKKFPVSIKIRRYIKKYYLSLIVYYPVFISLNLIYKLFRNYGVIYLAI